MNGVLLPLALIGATLIVVRGSIFSWLRRIVRMLECAQCTGFWIGAAAGGSGLVTLGHGWAVDALSVGCATSFLALLAQAVLIRLDDPN